MKPSGDINRFKGRLVTKGINEDHELITLKYLILWLH